MNRVSTGDQEYDPDDNDETNKYQEPAHKNLRESTRQNSVGELVGL